MILRPSKVPFFKDDPSNWENSWKILESTDTNDLLYERASFIEEFPQLQDEILSNHLINLRRLSSSQRGVATSAFILFHTHDFENQWRIADVGVREKHLLQGLHQTCLDVPQTRNERIYCNELTLPRLQENNGEGFLRLLKPIMAPDALAFDHPVFIPNPRWDDLKMDPHKKLSTVEGHAWDEIAIARGAFIAEFLLHVLNSFHGLDPPPISKIKGQSSARIDRKTKENLKELLGHSAAKEFCQGIIDDRKSLPRRCESCDKSTVQLGYSQFMVCKNCKDKVGRSVFYCSRACQRQDWRPRHKKLCGRPMTLDDIKQPSQPVKTFEQIGHAVDGYERADALQLQVTLLNLNPDVDYYLILPSGERDKYTIPFPRLKTAFRRHRDKALTSGNQRNVAVMSTLLLEGGTPRDEMLAQLQKEFCNYDVGAMVEQMIFGEGESPN